MTLVKGCAKTDSPTQIKREDGSDFETVSDLKDHVEQYFTNIYKRDANAVESNSVEQITKFLGPEIANRPEVMQSKLTEDEKVDLDIPITMEELEKSINSANFKSAPGPNGISNRFIKKFWEFLKRPLLKYSNEAFRTGNLSNSFRTADIKLIPKKGSDLSKIKNWRPISLLNCFYKCISRVFAFRLKKYMNKLTPCSQKGYANGRYCQEVLMSVLDNIETCKFNKTKGAILCLDIKKAFDSLSHSYMNNVLTFYNFGPNISRWLTVLCTNRAARIVILNDICTNTFELERGNAQGDTLSPFLFNLGYQILLFKLEFDVQILGLVEAVEIPADLPPLPVQASQVPPRVYALADDATVLTKMDFVSLTRIQSILLEFRLISGLECNVEKTTLMQVGSMDPITDDIKNMGFDIQTEIKLLGLKITQNGNYGSSLDEIEQKIRNQIRFWGRFQLSFAGRVNVSKTFMYSQINYLGCFLPIPSLQLTVYEDLIESYVKGPLNISKERMTLSREEGGVGLFKLSTFLGAQCCCWAKRAQTKDDNWKIRLFSRSFGTALNIRSVCYDPVKEPILYNIAKQFELFLCEHTKTKENIRESYIFLNKAITYGGENTQTVGVNFFGEESFMEQRSKIGSLLISHVLKQDGTPYSHLIFEQKSGVRISADKFDSLRRICSENLNAYIDGNTESKKSTDIITYSNRFKRGSKPFRKILVGAKKTEIPRQFQTFAENSQTIIGLEISRELGGLWGHSFLNHDMKEFLFKLHSGLLGLNNRVAHFINDHSPICTFCRLMRLGDALDESMLHLFYECPSTENIKDNFFRWFYNKDDQYFISRIELFHVQNEIGSASGTSLIKTMVAKFFLKYIWECKTRNTIPELDDAKEVTMATFKNISNTSLVMRNFINDSGLSNRLMPG
jgi:hypothetical protein